MSIFRDVIFVKSSTVPMVVIALPKDIKICLVVCYVQEFAELVLVGGPIYLQEKDTNKKKQTDMPCR